MNWLTTRMRISIGLACLTLSVLLLSMLIGILPDREKAVLEGRRALCEAIAVNSSIMVSQQDLDRLQAVLTMIAQRNPDILSAAIRREDGKLLVEVGEHAAQWKPLDDKHSIETQVQVPIHAGGKRWGNVEIRFRPVSQEGMMGFFFGPRSRLLWFVCGSCFVLFFFYMKKMLEYLDPSQAVPGHVRSALDTLAEGLLVIDGRDRIVLANEAFATMVGKSPDKLLGHVASRLPWVHEKEIEPPADHEYRCPALDHRAAGKDAQVQHDAAAADGRRRTADVHRQLVARPGKQRPVSRRAGEFRRRDGPRRERMRAAQGCRIGRRRQPHQERVPGQHEPRDPHPDERDPRFHRRLASRFRSRRADPPALPGHHPFQRQAPPGTDQRYSRPVQNRGRSPGDRAQSRARLSS